MALNINTFSSLTGGSSYYKAVSHPVAADAATNLINDLHAADGVAIYDPLHYVEEFAALYSMEGINLRGVYAQDIKAVGQPVLGQRFKPVTDLADADADIVFIAAYDAEKMLHQIGHLLPSGCRIASLDALRLPNAFLTNEKTYLDPMNFATNFVFFRDGADNHTRLVTTNYWARYGSSDIRLWLRLFAEDGTVIAEWTKPVPTAGQTILIDSREVRKQFDLKDFTGQLFIHAIGVTGHDVVKYALDVYGDSGNALSCTHDANAWPADLYAGLPAPADGEEVVLWIQNSHPNTIPAGAISFKLMGNVSATAVETEVAPFATIPIAVRKILPEAIWPQQVEISAGKYFVRPRYEVTSDCGDRRLAHVNVERTDLKPDPGIPEIGNLMGKGYILPAPILPVDIWKTIALPTPMATSQATLPIALLTMDPDGREIGHLSLGVLLRNHTRHVDLSEEMDIEKLLKGRFGHMELVYDFSIGDEADGWLHSLFRFENRTTGNTAETSFGAHIFNTILTYGDEPQSYTGRAPGLSTRLFLRLGDTPLETICHLIYPASTPWHGTSNTEICLHDPDGALIAKEQLQIPCGGSRFLRYSNVFEMATRLKAGNGAYIIISDASCRLFGYHGLIHEDGGFSLDHMFGF
ncbi:MAG: hypothetical protein VYA17_00750 [Pseudomonadota bacterium]|nr:hypothetical protein [Pseudomonadota bacterium]